MKRFLALLLALETAACIHARPQSVKPGTAERGDRFAPDPNEHLSVTRAPLPEESDAYVTEHLSYPATDPAAPEDAEVQAVLRTPRMRFRSSALTLSSGRCS